MELVYGLVGSSLIAGAAYKKRSLTGSGVLAAIVVGTTLYTWGNLVWFGLMIGFFISSTLLTKWKHHLKQGAEGRYQKTGRRDAGQVLANGGLGTLCCLIQAWQPESVWPLAAYLGVMATVTADTWATEIGGLSRQWPRSILTGNRVPKGTSGAVSGLGWTAAAAGGLFIGGLAVLLTLWVQSPSTDALLQGRAAWRAVAATMAAGWIGANADSLLGATVQALYRCPVCGEQVEGRNHCQAAASLIRGWRWMDNDAVNVTSSLCGGLVMLGLSLLIL